RGDANLSQALSAADAESASPPGYAAEPPGQAIVSPAGACRETKLGMRTQPADCETVVGMNTDGKITWDWATRPDR
ncbi:MAG: hypothetical protein M3145_01480, partial [Pseudomonadota bacterium]|nr:hypothetical protein [Pseudomonadota bacterium]